MSVTLEGAPTDTDHPSDGFEYVVPVDKVAESQSSRNQLGVGGVAVSSLVGEELVPSVEIRNGLEIRKIPGTEGYFNAGVWPDGDNVCCLGRKILGPGLEGEPDFNSVEFRILGKNLETIFSREVIPIDPSKRSNYEDVRATLLDDGRIVAGITHVFKRGENEYTPVPAIVVIPSTTALREGFLLQPRDVTGLRDGSDTMPIGEFASNGASGKNITAIGENIFMYRPDGNENNHTIVVFKVNDDGTADIIQKMELPKMPWSQNRAGLAMPPVPLNINNKRESVLILHGNNLVNHGGREVTADYSISSARLLIDKEGDDEVELTIDNIAPESLIDPSLFDTKAWETGEDIHQGESGSIELHKGKHVVYTTGGIAEYDDNGDLQKIRMFVTVGDYDMYEVTASREMLTKGWDNEPAEHLQFVAA